MIFQERRVEVGALEKDFAVGTPTSREPRWMGHVTAAWVVILLGGVLIGQTKPTGSSASGGQDFPVTMRQNVVAGTTPVGTKVEARLELATLASGTVLPAGAIFSGEVIESAAKTATDPSRLAIRMDSVRWKKGSRSIKAYLTGWYYPVRMTMGEPSLDADEVSTIRRTRRGSMASSPDSPTAQPEPAGQDVSPTPFSDKRTPLKDVESNRRSDGAVALSSTRVNIKLDKSTTYVLATENVLQGK